MDRQELGDRQLAHRHQQLRGQSLREGKQDMIGSILGMGTGFIMLLAVVWLLPVILILRSGKTNGAEKLVWVLLIFFFSWFSWLLYALLAPIGQQRR